MKTPSLHPTRRDFLQRSTAAAATVLVASAAAPVSLKAADKPNIIYILADDLGYGDVGCYGQTEIKTPNIDRLAADGLRFTDHYAGSTVCAPSRCSLMTGLHTGHTYIRGNRAVQPMGQEPLPQDTVTVAGLLKKAGYATALVGKWGLGAPGSTGIPNNQGFDYFFGYLGQRHAHNYYPEFLFRNSERVPLDGNVVENDRLDGAGEAVEKVTYAHDVIAGEALQFVESHKDEPFFLYFSPTIPHANNEAGDHGMEIPSDAPYTDRDWPQQQKNHAAMITRLDSDVGDLMELLKTLGIDRRTLVIFTSDNGPHREGGADPAFFTSSGPFKGIKRDLYEGGIRVPMIASWTGTIKPGIVTGHVSAFWDFMPTACELAGVVPPTGIDGISFLPVLTGNEDDQRRHEYLYWEFHEGSSSKQAVRRGQWKAVRLRPLGPIELYDLSSDAGEERNIASEYGEVVSAMRYLMDQARTPSRFWDLH